MLALFLILAAATAVAMLVAAIFIVEPDLFRDRPWYAWPFIAFGEFFETLKRSIPCDRE